MKALAYHGKEDVRVDNVPDPMIEAPDDIILRVTATAIKVMVLATGAAAAGGVLTG